MNTTNEDSIHIKNDSFKFIKQLKERYHNDFEINRRLDRIIEETARNLWLNIQNYPNLPDQNIIENHLQDALASAFISTRLLQKIKSKYRDVLNAFKKDFLGFILKYNSKSELKAFLEWLVMISRVNRTFNVNKSS